MCVSGVRGVGGWGQMFRGSCAKGTGGLEAGTWSSSIGLAE